MSSSRLLPRLFGIVCLILLPVWVWADANENPFQDGELNLEYEGELTGLAGEVMEIQPTPQKYVVYKLNLRLQGIKPIWVTSIVKPPRGGIHVGDRMIFKGYITLTNSLDPSGNLKALIGSDSLLLALRAERAR